MRQIDMSSAQAASELQELADLFDENHYLNAYLDVAEAFIDPFGHYCDIGWKEGRKPNPYFDGAWYLEQNPDVVLADMMPLLHYVRHGDREGRQPIPVFEPAWYRATYAVSHEQLALRHFLRHRCQGTVLPSPLCYAARHAEPFSTVAAGSRDPFIEFASVRGGAQAIAIERELIARSGLVDESYYLINGDDVLDADLDAVTHFCRWGWHERRNPNIYFDVGWYLATNPEVARLGINPLAHYVIEGEDAGRRPVVYFDPIWYRSKYGVPCSENVLAHYLRRRRNQTISPNPLFDVRWYLEHHKEEIGPCRDAFAHYLHAGMYRDIQPSPVFDAIYYRRVHLGRPSRIFRHAMRPDRNNPLVHYLLNHYSRNSHANAPKAAP